MTTASNKKKYLITTAIDYTNDVIHIGQAYEKILADCIARLYRTYHGEENVYFVTGTDEHGTTNEKAAKARDLTPLEHVTDISLKDKEQIDALNVSYNRYIRTTEEDHKKIASDFYLKSFENGLIYKGKYVGLYCEGCEAYKTLNELVDGKCPLHPTREIQHQDEENYFFKLSSYGPFLKELIESDTLLILPDGKRKEMLAFIENGLEDIPVTRPKFKLAWGITVPNDIEQVIYVWYDALINYYTAGIQQGFWNEETQIIHFVGKDIARWHTLLWPAMLKSAGIKLPDVVYVHGFINLEGQKISKSRGNVIRPSDLVTKYGVDVVRYYFLKYGPITEDVDISIAHLEEVYTADLANGLGNTVSRIAKLAANSDLEFDPLEINVKDLSDLWSEDLVSNFRVDLIIQKIIARLADLNKSITDVEPWKITDKAKLKEVLQYEINEVRIIAKALEPFIPDTSTKIQQIFANTKIAAAIPLFPKLS